MKRDMIRKYTSEPEDALMLAKVFDKRDACLDKNYVHTTRFLSLHECIVAETALRGEKCTNYALWGGYEGAERRLVVFYPDYMDEESARDEAGIRVIRASFRSGTVGHRDMLGSLMNIGITRECLGDLLVHEEFCDILCLEESASFIQDNLLRAGRETVRPVLWEGPPAEKDEKFKMIRDTVASLRLDSIVSSGCSVSRRIAGELIASGKVKLNDFECLKGDKAVAEGDVLSVRGYGKMLLHSVGGLSRKGRAIIEIKKFL